MRKTLIAVAITASLAALALVGCGGAQTADGPVRGNKGPILDRILLSANTQQDIALKDVAEGKADIFNYTTDGAAFKALPDEVKAKLDPYALTGTSYISLYFNPYPNAAPYTGKVDGKTVFNPFAIQQVRFAMNFIINRQKIIDEILAGAGEPMLSAVTPSQPNATRYDLGASKLGLTATGDEKKAIAMIDEAMQAAAALPENKGKLAKKGDFWQYAGKDIAVKFLIRVDDPTVRLPEGRYVADQIEKAGIKVERLEWDRTKCRAEWGYADPAKLTWQIYTEGWGGGSTNAFHEGNFAQMYAPWYASMPGGGNAEQWNYVNDELDSLTKDCVNGRVKDANEYYSKLLKANELGIKDSIRVWVAAQTVFTSTNKDRFNTRMAYGLGDGINKYSWYTADVKPEKNGAKVLREVGFSSRGDLFMSSWDPIGPDGCSDTYSQAVISAISDPEQFNSPTAGVPLPIRASWKDVKTDIEFQGDNIVGKIPVPADAVLWNTKTGKWDSSVVWLDLKGDGSEYGYANKTDKPENAMAWSKATFSFKFGKWHDGHEISIADYRYALARPYELSLKQGENDKVYDQSYSGSISPSLARYKGYVFNKDNTITVYGDANYPMDQASLAALLVPSLMLEASNYGTFVPWEIHEAMKYMVAEGAASGTAYCMNSDGNFTEIDLISEKCVADVKAKLQELAGKKFVPAQLVGFVTPEQAVKGYNDAIAFIDKHGHAYISNGGFMLDKYDSANKTAVLTAFRDSAYPFEKGYFTKLLATNFARVDNVKVAAFEKGKDVMVNATVSSVAFPSNKAKGAEKANVKVTLVGDKETTYTAKMLKAGSYEVAIPAADLANLKPGSYTVVVEAALGTEAGAVKTSNVIVF